MNLEALPSRLRESSFRKYENFIAEGIKNFPQHTTFPAPASGKPNLTTFCARFRDALSSYKTYKWPSKVIDEEKFKKFNDNISIKLKVETNAVEFSLRTSAHQTLVIKAPVKPVNAPDCVLTNLNEDEVKAFCLLLSNKRLNGPVEFLGEISVELYAELLPQHDIGIFYNPSTQITTII